MLNIPVWAQQPDALRRQLIRMAVETVQGDLTGFERRHREELEDACLRRPRGSLVDLPHQLQAERGATTLTLRRAACPAPDADLLAPDEILAVY